MFRTFAQFLFYIAFFRDRGYERNVWKFRRGGVIFLHKNGNSGEVGVLSEIPSVVEV